MCAPDDPEMGHINKMDIAKENRLNELILLHLQGDNTPHQLQQLAECLNEDAQAVDLYVEYMMQYAALYQPGSIMLKEGSGESSPSVLDTSLWEALSLYEKEAPSIQIPQEKPPRELIHGISYPPGDKRKISKLGMFFLIVNAAAMVFLVLFARFAPPKSGIAVATLHDSINARWADTNPLMRSGTRLKTGSGLLLLHEGLATLVFDNDTRIVMEGPAEFQILTNDQIKLNYGRLYAVVPPEAYGFQVTTPDAKIIDLGTEFGVQQDMHGNTELHVVKGKTSLVSGIRGNRINAYVEAKDAKRLDAGTGRIETIAYNERLFVRRIDSDTNFIWHGQTTLDLADIVAEGNGLGTGRPTARIHPAKGYTDEQNIVIYALSNAYFPLPSNPFLDGIFVPNGRTKQSVSTRGDVFDECPKTSGLYSVDLVANPEPELFLTSLRKGTIQFDGQIYGNRHRPCIVMHSNLGLTFDLETIREVYKSDITAFTSKIGIADLEEPYPCNVDFWVLVDGQVRYSLQQYKEKGQLTEIRITINPTDRFLTLATTDGGDSDDPASFYTRAISCDWGVFVEPALELE